MNRKKYLKWNDKHANDHIGQRQICYEKVGCGLHGSSCCDNPYNQRIPDDCYDADAAIKYGQQYDNSDWDFI